MLLSIVVSLCLLLIFQPCCEGVSESSQCHFKGYAPGGVLPKLTRISRVKPSKFQETVLDNVLEYFGNAVEIPKATLDVIGTAKNVLKAAPVMSAALGVVAASMELSNSPQPSPNDILNKAHQSINLLTEEVNERLDQMKDYVDATASRIEKDIMTKNYRTLADRWFGCGRIAPGRNSDDCQMTAEELISSERFKFQQLQPKFDQKDRNGKQLYDPNFGYRKAATWQWIEEYTGRYVWPLSHAEVRRIEAGLIPFRDYATLHLLVMKTLAMTYKEDGKKSCKSYKFYEEKIQRKADYYSRYARWAYEWIYIRQFEENMYFGVPGRVGGPATAKRGGYLGTRVCRSSQCSMQCSQMIRDSLCTVKNSRKRETLSARVSHLCESYMLDTKRALTEYWKNNLLNVATRWEKYRDEAKKILSKLKCE